MNFKDLNLSKQMLDTLALIGYKEPSPIQAEAIPVALAGKDIIGQAQTGTGKTASFGIPLIELTEPGKGIQHVILAPSRELATQIYNEIHKLAANKGIKVIDIIGGVSYTIQKRALSQNPDIIVATPGRYIDNLEKGLIKHENVKTFTLDEADEMLNFGFLKEIKKIRASIKNEVQTFFFTATFNAKIRKLATEILNNPKEITISGGLSTNERVDQKFVVMKERQKLTTLISLLQLLEPKAAVIFGRTKRRVEELSGALKTLGFNAVGIQGDMRQRERSVAMKSFREGRTNILVGTDVMARGIDVDTIDYVFNFDLPTEIEAYTHRIGRTGRAGRKGTSVTFVKDSETSYFDQIMKATQSEVEKWPIPTDQDLKEVKEKRLDENLSMILKVAKKRFNLVGKKIGEQYTREELGAIIAHLAIGEAINSHDIKLTGEQGMDKGKGRGGRSGNRSGGYGNRRDGGNRSRGPRSGGNNQRGRSNDPRKSSSQNPSSSNARPRRKKK